MMQQQSKLVHFSLSLVQKQSKLLHFSRSLMLQLSKLVRLCFRQVFSTKSNIWRNLFAEFCALRWAPVLYEISSENGPAYFVKRQGHREKIIYDQYQYSKTFYNCT
jgi:hypothetical protein